MGHTDDLTKGKTYSASSTYSTPDYQASNAFDGNVSTSWFAQSGGGVGEWVAVDLGSSYAVTKLRMICNPYRLTDFKLQGSNNYSDWYDVYSDTNPNNTVWRTYVFANTTSYRYYRIYCDGTITAPVNVTDIEMMASVEEYSYDEYTEDLTGGQTYFASTEFSTPDYQASNAFDGNEGNNWYAVGDNGQYVGVDFGSGDEKAITKLRLLCNPSRLSNFKFQGSNNYSDWYSVYVGQRANNTSWQEFKFANTTEYRYYRILSIEDYYSSTNINVSESEMMEAVASITQDAGVTGIIAESVSTGIVASISATRSVVVTGLIAESISTGIVASIGATRNASVTGIVAESTSTGILATVSATRNPSIAGVAAESTSTGVLATITTTSNVSVTGLTSDSVSTGIVASISTASNVNIVGITAESTSTGIVASVSATRNVAITGIVAESQSTGIVAAISATRNVSITGLVAESTSTGIVAGIVSTKNSSVTGVTSGSTSTGIVAVISATRNATATGIASNSVSTGILATISLTSGSGEITGVTAESTSIGIVAVVQVWNVQKNLDKYRLRNYHITKYQ